MSETPEQMAWRLWQEDHPDEKSVKHWEQVPYWEQKAYLGYLLAE